jgi:hypothetical protein
MHMVTREVTHSSDDRLRISWIDREGAIVSTDFSFLENIPLLLVLLLVLQRFGRSQWGYIPELSTEDHSVFLHPIHAGGSLDEDEVPVNFYPEDKVHSAWSLLGRATTVVGANRNDDGRAGVSSTKVLNEAGEVQDEELHDFYQAQKDYRKASTDTINSHDLVLKVSWPEMSRVKEWKIIERARTLGEKNQFIKGHIPEVKFTRDFDRYSTNHIRRFLGLHQEGQSGTRTLRAIVMKRLRPIYDLDGKQFWKAFWQSFTCTNSPTSL